MASADPDPKLSETPRLLIVEDERAQRDVLARKLVRDGFEVVAVESAETALLRLSGTRFHALVTDVRLPNMDGLELIRRVRDRDEQLPTIVMTAFGSLETAVEALRAGAHDYILKPLFFEELSRKLRHLLAHRELIQENTRLRWAVQEWDSPELIGVSKAIDDVRDWVRRAASTDSTVLITGETGTGKEVVAQAIHRLGPHGEEPLLVVNVAALPENTVESELFGHERGAFTGAQSRRDGILRAAGAGTVFLDEIGELSSGLQAKLLRALEVREILPVGSDRPATFAARILCATHRDLRARVQTGEFREDLFYRLNVLHIAIPPLRERPEDVPPLTRHLLERLCQRQRSPLPVITAAAMQVLAQYRWPGNVRELANVLERALLFADDGQIEAEQLPIDLEQTSGEPGLQLKDAVADFERRHIAKVLRMCGGSREHAAKELGLSAATLYRRLERLDLKGDRAADVR